MTVTDQIQILDKRIKQNEAQYDLDKKAGKISVSSSRDLDKYEYLTVEDLDYKSSTVEQAKFDYFLLVTFLTKDCKKKTKRRAFEETKEF